MPAPKTNIPSDEIAIRYTHTRMWRSLLDRARIVLAWGMRAGKGELATVQEVLNAALDRGLKEIETELEIPAWEAKAREPQAKPQSNGGETSDGEDGNGVVGPIV